VPSLAALGRASATLVYDGRFRASRDFAKQAAEAFDCGPDAARLWFARLAREPSGSNAIFGLTTPADAMVLADCARRDGRRFTTVAAPAHNDQLVEWTISPAGRPAAPQAPRCEKRI
jgi:hypothetical protein